MPTRPESFREHIGFALPIAIGTQANPSGKSQRAVSAYAQTDNNSNTFYIEKQDSRKINSILADSF